MKKDIRNLLIVVIFCGILLYWLNIHSVAGNLYPDIISSEQFCRMEIEPEVCSAVAAYAQATGESFRDVLAVYMIESRFRGYEIPDWEDGEYSRKKELLLRYYEKAFRAVREAYGAVWEGAAVFPVAGNGISEFYFENSWGANREYGGKRRHEGTDIFGKSTLRGYYPVVSVCDGTVEKVGWLPLGGYRIGIRSKYGGYYYYAHLDSYEKEFQIGQQVCKGEILGLMGDSGYGEEGTKGKFPVHLHFGIYINGKDNQEISVNPYALLRYQRKNIRKYVF